MVEIEISPTHLIIHVAGADKILAFKSQLTVPLAHVVKAEADPTPALRYWKGWRLPGTSVPGVLTAGSFYQHGEWTFWDVRDPEKTIVVHLAHEHYKALVVEVDDPQRTTQSINAVVATAR
ncbi:MAG TPA: hypothetical protein VK881_05915 [bacterium]|nr:hypothetical protein [bacterium]